MDSKFCCVVLFFIFGTFLLVQSCPSFTIPSINNVEWKRNYMDVSLLVDINVAINENVTFAKLSHSVNPEGQSSEIEIPLTSEDNIIGKNYNVSRYDFNNIKFEFYFNHRSYVKDEPEVMLIVKNRCRSFMIFYVIPSENHYFRKSGFYPVISTYPPEELQPKIGSFLNLTVEIENLRVPEIRTVWNASNSWYIEYTFDSLDEATTSFRPHAYGNNLTFPNFNRHQQGVYGSLVSFEGDIEMYLYTIVSLLPKDLDAIPRKVFSSSCSTNPYSLAGINPKFGGSSVPMQSYDCIRCIAIGYPAANIVLNKVDEETMCTFRKADALKSSAVASELSIPITDATNAKYTCCATFNTTLKPVCDSNNTYQHSFNITKFKGVQLHMSHSVSETYNGIQYVYNCSTKGEPRPDLIFYIITSDKLAELEEEETLKDVKAMTIEKALPTAGWNSTFANGVFSGEITIPDNLISDYISQFPGKLFHIACETVNKYSFERDDVIFTRH